MRQRIFFIAVVLSVFLIGCGKGEMRENVPQDKVENSEEDFKFAELIPDHSKYFEKGVEMIIDPDGGEGYCIQVKNVKKDEYQKYRAECKNMGFSKVSCETETMFQARTNNEKYYVSVQWVESTKDASQNSVNITCGNVKK